jgi:hypothetical protein
MGPVVATADAEGDFPELEMGEELVPLTGGEITVFWLQRRFTTGPWLPPAATPDITSAAP